jgi:hypothetical protein
LAAFRLQQQTAKLLQHRFYAGNIYQLHYIIPGMIGLSGNEVGFS